MEIKVIGRRSPVDVPWAIHRQKDAVVVNCCSNSSEGWQRDLSPFIIGPVELYGEYVSKTFENLWQYVKVYHEHLDENKEPTQEYWDWAKQGWDNPRAVRYPMGKGRRPAYSLWDGKKLDYITARKVIYVPLYATAVQKTAGFQYLKELAKDNDIILRDFDGYDETAMGMSLLQVLNYPQKKMGHAFVLKMLLTNDQEALEEIWKVSQSY